MPRLLQQDLVRMMIDDLIRKDLKDFVPYKVNEDRAEIILDANESPYDLSTDVKEKLTGYINGKSGLNRYPDTSSSQLRNKLASKYGCLAEQIMVGTGSDQLISVLVHTFIEPGDVVLVPYPSFEMYRITSLSAFADVREYELDPKNGYAYDPKRIKTLIDEHKPKLVYICSPNNPTGNILSNEEIEDIARSANRSVIVLDEAYAEFSDRSYIDRLDRTGNVIILRTFSKAYGLAGLRCGYSISPVSIAECMLKAIPPYNIGSFSQIAAAFVLEDEAGSKKRIKSITDERERIIEALLQTERFVVYPSYANFVLVKTKDGTDLYSELIRKGIRIRKFGNKRLLEDSYRITIGTREENDRFLDAVFDIF